MQLERSHEGLTDLEHGDDLSRWLIQQLKISPETELVFSFFPNNNDYLITTVGTSGNVLFVKRSRRAPIISVSAISGIESRDDDVVLCLGPAPSSSIRLVHFVSVGGQTELEHTHISP